MIWVPGLVLRRLPDSRAATLEDADILRRGPPLVSGHLIQNPLPLLKRRRPSPTSPRVAHEEVLDKDFLAPAEGGDETVASLLAEPLYLSLSHILRPPFLYSEFHHNRKLPPGANPLWRYAPEAPVCSRSSFLAIRAQLSCSLEKDSSLVELELFYFRRSFTLPFFSLAVPLL
jgi:hypothetical protein